MKSFRQLGPSQTSKMERKNVKPLTIFAKALSWMYDWVLNTSLQGFVQDAPRKELAIVECCINNKLALSGATDT